MFTNSNTFEDWNPKSLLHQYPRYPRIQIKINAYFLFYKLFSKILLVIFTEISLFQAMTKFLVCSVTRVESLQLSSYQVIKDSICPPIPFDLASAAIQLQGACVCVCVCVCVSSTLKTYCQLCLNCEFPLILFPVLPDEILAKKHNYKPARVCVRVLGENNMSIRNESHIVPV